MSLQPSQLRITVAITALVFVIIISCTSTESEKKKDSISDVREKENGDMVSRGKYLATAIGCNDCHSPKIMTARGPLIDSSKVLSGHPANMALMPFTAEALKPGGWIQMEPDLTAFVGPWAYLFQLILHLIQLQESEHGMPMYL